MAHLRGVVTLLASHTLLAAGVYPNFNGVGGAGQLKTVIGALMTIVLIVAVLMMIVCAATWAVASAHGNYQTATKARTGLLVAVGAELADSGDPPRARPKVAGPAVHSDGLGARRHPAPAGRRRDRGGRSRVLTAPLPLVPLVGRAAEVSLRGHAGLAGVVAEHIFFGTPLGWCACPLVGAIFSGLTTPPHRKFRPGQLT